MEKAFQHKERRLALRGRMLKEIKEERKGKSNGGDESFDNMVSAYALAKSSVVMVLMKVAMLVKRGWGDGNDDSIFDGDHSG